MTELDPEIIKKTQNTLGKYVKKPALTEKLLKKPPFRFLHDIITSVIQSSGYFEGLFEPDEMVSANIKDKEGKILFLQKVIDVVKISTKENVDAKPSKIVAGHEPEKTNELLQLIGTALSRKISSDEAVKLVKNGAVPKSNKNSSNKSSKIIKQSSIDSVKTKSKSSEDAKTTTLKDNNKIIQKVKDGNKDVKDKITEKPSKDRKEKETKSTKISRDVKKSSKEAKSGEKVKSEKAKTKIDSEAKKTSSKSIKEEPVNKVEEEKKISSKSIKEELDKKVEEVTDSKVKSVPEASHETLDNTDPMGEVIHKSNNSLQSFEPEIVSIQVQSGLPKSTNEQIIDNVPNGDIPEKEKSPEKSARRSGKRERKLVSDEKVDDEIKDEDDMGNKSEIETVPQITSDNENIMEQNDIPQEKEKPKLSKKTSGKKENPEISNSNDTTSTRNVMVSSKNKSVDKPSSIPRPRTSLRPPSVRPASARPGAPRRRDRNVEIILQPDGNMPKPGVNIKIDHLNMELDDDGENLVIIEDSTSQTNDNKFGIDVLNENDEEQQGHLVQQILETQKEFLKIDEEANESKKRKDSEWDSTNSHQRQTSAKQMDSLRDSIQKLTRSINPLGKLMDFLQEDVDSMQMELSMWKNSYATTKIELRHEEGLTESAIEPLKLQLAQIESDIKDQIEIMDLARVDIMENEEKILKLLTEM